MYYTLEPVDTCEGSYLWAKIGILGFMVIVLPLFTPREYVPVDLRICLKYHITHGSCNFAPPKDLELVQALLERKRKDRAATLAAAGGSSSNANSSTPGSIGNSGGNGFPMSATLGNNGSLNEDDFNGGTASASGSGWNSPATLSSPFLGSGSRSGPSSRVATAPSSPSSASMTNTNNDNPTHGTNAHSSFGGGADGMNGLSGMAGMADLELSEQELVALSLEAGRKLKPFACGVGDCPRRYKNMNGLRYHYTHSGEHGAVGLAMLASSVHECLQNNHHSNKSHSHHHRERDKDKEGGSGGNGTCHGEREGGRKMRSVGSKPTSRAESRSRTGTPALPPLPPSLPPSTSTLPITATATSPLAPGVMTGESMEGKTGPLQAPSFAAAQITEMHQIHAATGGESGSSSTETPRDVSPTANATTITTPIQAQFFPAQGYPQRYMEHQRAQYVAQVQQQQQQASVG
ncbi:hypothetical protein K435DRAFT_804660 [Dendrothele bispora CBS 962.96]|uniref:C2H2-type domain-containing protein n=1 Tax=Dendrothele bispora (strain CBS 962.96) TaxID=1314807 RepID=A0A4S8LEB9_DENBC|nr:hypothetical protein K435DRAFT_804660 [Dendrothele bispora CBS 962.96]